MRPNSKQKSPRLQGRGLEYCEVRIEGYSILIVASSIMASYL